MENKIVTNFSSCCSVIHSVFLNFQAIITLTRPFTLTTFYLFSTLLKKKVKIFILNDFQLLETSFKTHYLLLKISLILLCFFFHIVYHPKKGHKNAAKLKDREFFRDVSNSF